MGSVRSIRGKSPGSTKLKNLAAALLFIFGPVRSCGQKLGDYGKQRVSSHATEGL